MLLIGYERLEDGVDVWRLPRGTPVALGGTLGMPVPLDPEVLHSIHEKNAARDVLGGTSLLGS